jgi:hypothetical protein
MFPVEHYGDMFPGEHFVQAEVYVQSRHVYEKKRECQNGNFKKKGNTDLTHFGTKWGRPYEMAAVPGVLGSNCMVHVNETEAYGRSRRPRDHES